MALMDDENDKKDGSERRVHSRVDFFSEVHVSVPDDDIAIDVVASNVSKGGIFLRSNRPLEKGKKVSLRFKIDSEEVEVKQGEVVWTKPFEPISVDGEPAGMGVQFESLTDESQNRIAAFIDEELTDEAASPAQAEPPLAPPVSPPAPRSEPVSSAFARPPASVTSGAEEISEAESVPEPQTPPSSGAPAGRMKLALRAAPSGADEVAPAQAQAVLQGEPLMVSDPPPARSKALLFGGFVVIVAVVVFITLYMLVPFGSESEKASAVPDKQAVAKPAPQPGKSTPPSSPAAKEDVSLPPAASEPAKTEAPSTPVPQPKNEPKNEPKPEVSSAPAGALSAGEPVFSRSSQGWRMLLTASGNVEFKHFVLKDPPRLAVDIKKATYAGSVKTLEAPPPFIVRVRVGEQPDFTRYVIDFKGPGIPGHKIVKDKDRITIVFDR